MRDIAIENLLEAARPARRLLILPHNDPDPDAIASALALAEILHNRLNIETIIAYSGIIGRAENRALVDYLRSPIKALEPADFKWADGIALIDTQPGSGNHPLPADYSAVIVIDHHPVNSNNLGSRYTDIANGYGASSSMMTEYLQASGIEPNQALATALFYGVKTDTRGLSRDTFQADIDAYLYLLPKIDHEALARIEYAPVPDSYFKTLVETLHNASCYDQVVAAYCGESDYPDMAAEMADFLLRIKNAVWVVCTTAYQQSLIVSVRTKREDARADTLVRSIVGLDGTAGGHGMMAGGQISLGGKTAAEKSRLVHNRALHLLGVPEGLVGKPLIEE